ncbi:MAG: DUF4249 family protein, partial [Sphingobacteriales bacterium]
MSVADFINSENTTPEPGKSASTTCTTAGILSTIRWKAKTRGRANIPKACCINIHFSRRCRRSVIRFHSEDRSMKKFGWLIGILGLFSCQNLRQEVQPQQLADQPVKLLVACFISPQDTVLAAKVARSRPILDDETVTNLEITNATVTLQTGSRSIVLTYHSRLRYYRASPGQFPIRAGETYQLWVQTPDGQSVEARTTVPEAVSLQQVRLDSEVV